MAKKKERKQKTYYDPLKVRKKLIASPQVKNFTDFEALGTIRILHRKDKTEFAELALTNQKKKRKVIEKALNYAGFTKEARGKWCLRTNKFNVFVYT